MSAPVIAGLTFVVLAVLDSATLMILIASITFSSIIPILAIVYFARSQKSLNFDIPERTQRLKPFLAAIVSYVIGVFVLLNGQAPRLITGLMLAYVFNTVLMLMITVVWKISVHAAGIAGPISFLVYRLGFYSVLLYALVVPVGLVKLEMREHTAPQIIAGAVVTLIVTWLQLFFIVPNLP